MHLISVTPGLPIIGLVITAPTLVVLFGGAFLFANGPQQRMTNLLLGFVFSVAAIFAIAFLYRPIPNSWGDDNFGLLVIGAAPIGAAVGLAICIGCRRATDADHSNDILFKPFQPGITRTCPKCLAWFSLVFVKSRQDQNHESISTYRCNKCGVETEFASHHPPDAI